MKRSRILNWLIFWLLTGSMLSYADGGQGFLALCYLVIMVIFYENELGSTTE